MSISHILFSMLKRVSLFDLISKEDVLTKYLKKELALTIWPLINLDKVVKYNYGEVLEGCLEGKNKNDWIIKN